MEHRGKHSLVYFDGKKEIILPLLNEKKEVETVTSYLSTWDSITMKFKNKEELYFYYQSLGYLKEDMMGEGRFYIRTNESKKVGFQALDVAYEDDLLLQEAIIKGSNQVDKNNYYVNRFLKNFMRDMKQKEPFLRGLIYPVSQGMNKEYLDAFLLDRIKYILYFKGHAPSEALSIEEEKERKMKQVKSYLLDNYRRFRGVYFFHKDLCPNRLILINHDILTEKELECHFDYDKLDENNPYIWEDPYDHPEDEISYLLPENPDSDKAHGHRTRGGPNG